MRSRLQQLVVVKGLHAEADAVEAQLAQPSQVRRVDGARVGFQRDLGVVLEGELLAAWPRTIGAICSSGSSDGVPPPKNTVADLASPQRRRPQRRLARDGLGIGGHQGVLARVRVEVAVRTLGGAERDVDVEGEGSAAHGIQSKRCAGKRRR